MPRTARPPITPPTIGAIDFRDGEPELGGGKAETPPDVVTEDDGDMCEDSDEVDVFVGVIEELVGGNGASELEGTGLISELDVLVDATVGISDAAVKDGAGVRVTPC